MLQQPALEGDDVYSPLQNRPGPARLLGLPSRDGCTGPGDAGPCVQRVGRSITTHCMIILGVFVRGVLKSPLPSLYPDLPSTVPSSGIGNRADMPHQDLYCKV
jgi:hypothetical protein